MFICMHIHMYTYIYKHRAVAQCRDVLQEFIHRSLAAAFRSKEHKH